MPPWKADPHVGVKFKDVRTLSEQDIATMVAWAEAGAPEGNPADLPPPPSFPTTGSSARPTWSSTSAPTSRSRPSGDDIYRCFVVPTQPRERSVRLGRRVPGRQPQGRPSHPGLRRYLGQGPRARSTPIRGRATPASAAPASRFTAAWAAGRPATSPAFLPEGIGRSLPKQSDVIIQVHYHPSGKAETDRSKIGLYFAKKPVKQTLHWSVVINPGLVLPPGQSNIEVKAAWEVPVDITAHAVTPHMHLLGHDMQISVKFPDGHVQDLIRVPDWDFNWQYTYNFEKPLDIPKGSIVYLVSHYDNSSVEPPEPATSPPSSSSGARRRPTRCASASSA